jgi:NAD(P)-dependent dehydrogenase (short-subunit alcohol dehydrogenase family)
MSRLDNKVAIITGAASGMGRATAIRFAGEGAAVVVADLNQEGGESTVRECREQGGNAVFQKADVSSEGDIKALVAHAVSEFGRLDITFNNAGLVGALGSLEEVTVESWDKTHAILLRGVFLGIKHSIAPMRQAGGGSIISTASIAGMRGGFGPLVYCRLNQQRRKEVGASARRPPGRARPQGSRMRRAQVPGAKPGRSREPPRSGELGLKCKAGSQLRLR